MPQDAVRRGRSTIDPAGLLFGMVEVEGALANQLLRDLGVELGDLRAAIQQA